MKTKEKNQLIKNAIEVWQSTPYFHPLTCGNDSNHKNLVAFEDNDSIKLKCLDCDYIQDHIPLAIVAFAGFEEKSFQKRFLT
jgi:hypothetical protein